MNSNSPALGAHTQDTSAGEYVVLSLGDLLRVVWRRLWVIILVALVFAGTAVGYSLAQTPEYEASTMILIGQAQVSGEQPSGLGGEIGALQDVTPTMSEAVATRPVAEEVVQRLGLPMSPADLLAGLNAEEVSDTLFIEVSYTGTDPERASQIVNSVGDVFSERISEVSPSASAITATVWESAVAPNNPVSPQPRRDGVLAFVLGAMLGVGLAFLLENLDDSWRSPEEVEQVSGVPTLGTIPGF